MIATLTFHQAINYGAVLQAYALQRKILDMEKETVVLNYDCPRIRRDYYGLPRSPRAIVGRLLRLSWRRKKIDKFKLFREVHLQESKPVTRKSLSFACREYDAIIVGSDQVWNPELTGHDLTYYLDFVCESSRKKAYAVSLGLSAWSDEDEKIYANLAGDFSSISTREITFSEYLGALIYREVPVVCDPVMLLEADRWRDLAKAPNRPAPYLLIFYVGSISSECLEWSKKIADLRGLDIIAIHGEVFDHRGLTNIKDAGPEEFLGFIDNASFVVTDSFHGTSFSILFEKDFVWFRSHSESVELARRSGRLSNLLTEYCLSSREVDGSSLELDAINYDNVKQIVASKREESIAYLRDLL